MESILTGYEYLRPPIEVNLVQHEPQYIKNGFKEAAQRQIFYEVPLDDFELSKIQELENELRKRGIRLPPGWNERETLRYVYGARFNLENAISNIQTSLRWRGARNNTVISEQATRLLESGAIYTYGRDNQYRPIVIIDIGKLNPYNFDVENFQVALITLLDILKEYCFVPGRVENWIVIVDAKGKDFSNLPSKDLEPVFTLLSACYPVTLEKLAIVNASPSILSSWKTLENLVSPATLKKVDVIEPNKINRLHFIAPRGQLESKFGGALPDLTKFWIPRVPLNTYSPTRTNANLENSLARLSQQIESVEGRFQKILSSDSKYQGPPQTSSPQVKANNVSPYSYQSPGDKAPAPFEDKGYVSRYQAPAEQEKRSSYPVQRQYTESTFTFPAYQERRTDQEAVKKSYQTPTPQYNVSTIVQPEVTPEHSQIIDYDFNERNLLDLIETENDSLMIVKPGAKESTFRYGGTTTPQERVVKSSNAYPADPYTNPQVQEILKDIGRSSAGDRYKTLSESYAPQSRQTQLLESTITRHEPVYEREKKTVPYYSSSPYNPVNGTTQTTTEYVTRTEYSTQPNPRFVQGRTEYEIAKSNLPVEVAKKEAPRDSAKPLNASAMRTSQASTGNTGNKNVEEWQYQKYAKKKDEQDDLELDDGSNFCGMCVAPRKKETIQKA